MRAKTLYTIWLSLACIGGGVQGMAQEFVAPLMRASEPFPESVDPGIPRKTTALSLPFFEDFCQDSPIPHPLRWADRQVYVNNTMGVGTLSCGMASFDALNAQGQPYHSRSTTVVLRADSLTSQPIDLSAHQPQDSLYLSFYYQPQGNGYYPEVHDSLMLYFRDTSQWVQVWAVPGQFLHEFRGVMIPIRDPRYFHAGFRMRWINKASINTNDDHWNLDYILLDAGRNWADTLIEDIAFTSPPSGLLRHYTAMPYHQFLADADQQRAAGFEAPLRNHYPVAQSVQTAYRVRDTVSGQLIHQSPWQTVELGGNQTHLVTYPAYASTLPAPPRHASQVWEHRFYIQAQGSGPRTNDTLVRHLHFGQYFAYDDGTAELSYFLKLFPSLPGKLAIGYSLIQPDTLTGMAIYFGRQVPSAENKYFSLVIYDRIEPGGSEDHPVYEQEFLQPGYLNTNQFYYYRFDRPIPLPAGEFFAGITMPAMSNSDSLYFGLDIHRAADNHLYYNVIDRWVPSGISGALMVRPVVGPFFPSQSPESPDPPSRRWEIFPNPVNQKAWVQFSGDDKLEFRIFDLSGRLILQGRIQSGDSLDLSALAPGAYLIRLEGGGRSWVPRRLVKW